MSVPVREGQILAGKYRVERILGQGGLGVVVAATHLQLDQRVALKFLLEEPAEDGGQWVLRFQREAKIAARLKSEHVTKVSDVGTLEDGSPYIVMEFLEGRDLADLVEKRGSLPVSEAVDYLVQACEGIAEAHSAGIVHRDLKPGNLFLTTALDGSPLVKVLDFGISKTKAPVGSSDPSLTSTKGMMGSPLYMPPEQLQSAKHVDHRADIYALGAVLRELLVGSPPFMSDSLAGLCVQILQTSPTPMASLRPDIPPELDAIVSRCLEKDPSKRFESVAQLVVALAPFGTPAAQHNVDRVSRLAGVAPSVRAGSRRSGSAEAGSAPAMAATEAAPLPPGIPATSPAAITNKAWGGTRGEGGPATAASKGRRVVMVGAGVGLVAVVGAAGILATGVATTERDAPASAQATDKSDPPVSMSAAPESATSTTPGEAERSEPADSAEPKEREHPEPAGASARSKAVGDAPAAPSASTHLSDEPKRDPQPKAKAPSSPARFSTRGVKKAPATADKPPPPKPRDLLLDPD